jgi:hypothetical protein
MTSIPRDAAGTSRLLTSGTQKSDADAGAGAGGVDDLWAPACNDAVLGGRGAAEGVTGLGTLCRYGEMTSYGESDSTGPTSSLRSSWSGGSKPRARE